MFGTGSSVGLTAGLNSTGTAPFDSHLHLQLTPSLPTRKSYSGQQERVNRGDTHIANDLARLVDDCDRLGELHLDNQ